MRYDVTAEAQARGERRRCGHDPGAVPVLVPQHGAPPGRGRRRPRGSGAREQLCRGVVDAVRVEVAHDERVLREQAPALSDGLAASAPVGDLETSRGRGTPAVPRNPLLLLVRIGPRAGTGTRRRGQCDESAAMHDDGDGHTRTWDLVEAHAQDEVRDSIGRVVPEGKPGRGASTVPVRGGVEDGALFGVALCKVEPSALAKRGEVERGDQLHLTGFFDELVKVNCVFGHVDKCEERLRDPRKSHCKSHCWRRSLAQL